jgi:hypothetical protein
MTWHVRYRDGAAEELVRFLTPELAIDSACELIDRGCEVFSIGMETLEDSISMPEIMKIYAIWELAKRGRGLLSG